MGADCCGSSVRFEGLSADYKRCLWVVIAVNGDTASVKLDGPGDLIVAANASNTTSGAAVTLAFRPEKTMIRDANIAADRAGNVLQAEVIEETYVGSRYEYKLRYGDAVFETYARQNRVRTVDESLLQAVQTSLRADSALELSLQRGDTIQRDVRVWYFRKNADPDVETVLRSVGFSGSSASARR